MGESEPVGGWGVFLCQCGLRWGRIYGTYTAGICKRTQAELEALRVRHAKEILDLKTVIAERDDRLSETRENALALESDVNTVRTLGLILGTKEQASTDSARTPVGPMARAPPAARPAREGG